MQVYLLHIHNVHHIPKDALLHWDLITVKATGKQWTHCDYQETSLKWFCFVTRCKRRSWLTRSQNVTGKYCPHRYTFNCLKLFIQGCMDPCLLCCLDQIVTFHLDIVADIIADRNFVAYLLQCFDMLQIQWWYWVGCIVFSFNLNYFNIFSLPSPSYFGSCNCCSLNQFFSDPYLWTWDIQKIENPSLLTIFWNFAPTTMQHSWLLRSPFYIVLTNQIAS